MSRAAEPCRHCSGRGWLWRWPVPEDQGAGGSGKAYRPCIHCLQTGRRSARGALPRSRLGPALEELLDELAEESVHRLCDYSPETLRELERHVQRRIAQLADRAETFPPESQPTRPATPPRGRGAPGAPLASAAAWSWAVLKVQAARRLVAHRLRNEVDDIKPGGAK